MSTIISLIVGLALLVAGAEFLVRGSASLALRLGIQPLVIGLTIVALGTSSPELLVSVKAALQNSPGLSLGNVIGSNICNIALILGIAAVIRPIEVHRQLLRLDIPVMVVSSIVLCLFLLNGILERWEGALLFAALLAYVGYSIIKARQMRAALETFDTTHGDIEIESRRPLTLFALIAGGLTLLLIGANLFVDGAIALAEMLGVSKAVIGLTIVALGTSLPELATSVVASVKKEGDISAGNVIGSNIFNLLCILGITALIQPLLSDAITTIDLLTMLGVACLTLPLLRTGFTLSRIEGAFLLLIYAGYTYSLF